MPAPQPLSRRTFLYLSWAAFVSACTAPGRPTVTSIPTPSRTALPADPVAAVTPTLFPTPSPAMTSTLAMNAKRIHPDDPHITYSGRIDFSDPKRPRFSAPGVYIRAAFRGTAAAVWLEDEFKWGHDRNYYDVVLDGTAVFKLAPQKTVQRYVAFTGLPQGEHTLTLHKRTEAGIGFSEFLGFEFDGEILPSAPRSARRIEWIGDSITCGAGNEAANESPECLEDGWGQPYHNARLSYAAITARRLQAEYHLTAVSGIGLVRNYSNQYDARPLPEVYDLIYLENAGSPAWEPARFVPDVLSIALGTNDFSPGDGDRPRMDVDTFASAYLQFAGKLRRYYPAAHIFCVSSPMLGDGWPEAADRFATRQREAISQVVDDFNRRGDEKVHKFFSTHLSGRGCGTHPDVAQHEFLAEELSAAIASVMGW
ncbi:MAG: SGNH/GDSL hydrolase family protein [Chloroflexota bacterium]